MDFGALPPEINSGRMYVGAGPAPMLAASVAWDGLSTELGLAASAFGSVVSGLVAEQWLGPASMSMLAATTPHVTWMRATAEVAEHTAAQARAVAAAFETAFAMTVPPPVIAANRAALMTLIATNFFGQNTAAIAATEALYGEMWAQDATAMYTYQGSTLASALTPFTPPESTDDVADMPVDPSTQGATSAGRQLAATSSRPLQTVPPPTKPTPDAPPPPMGPLEHWGHYIHPIDSTVAPAKFFFGTGDKGYKLLSGLAPKSAKAAGDGAKAAAGAAGAAGLPGFGGVVGGAAGSPPMSAGLGKAASVGGVSVPSSWPSAAPVSTPASPLPLSSPGGAAHGPAGLLRGIPLTGAGGRRSADGFVHRYGFRHSVIPRPSAAG